jgi:hypothetical protein
MINNPNSAVGLSDSLGIVPIMMAPSALFCHRCTSNAIALGTTIDVNSASRYITNEPLDKLGIECSKAISEGGLDSGIIVSIPPLADLLTNRFVGR